MESKMISFRMADALWAAAEACAAAEGTELRAWIRGLVERETGVKVEMKEGGLAHMSKRRRREVQAAGVKARHAPGKKRK